MSNLESGLSLFLITLFTVVRNKNVTNSVRASPFCGTLEMRYFFIQRLRIKIWLSTALKGSANGITWGIQVYSRRSFDPLEDETKKIVTFVGIFLELGSNV